MGTEPPPTRAFGEGFELLAEAGDTGAVRYS